MVGVECLLILEHIIHFSKDFQLFHLVKGADLGKFMIKSMAESLVWIVLGSFEKWIFFCVLAGPSIPVVIACLF